MTARKTFRKLILDASFLLIEAKERMPNTESDRWHIEEALMHLAHLNYTNNLSRKNKRNPKKNES